MRSEAECRREYGCIKPNCPLGTAERHDNIEAIYKKLTERRDTADVTELLKELHRIINEAIRWRRSGARVDI
jgi:hypothetical protein